MTQQDWSLDLDQGLFRNLSPLVQTEVMVPGFKPGMGPHLLDCELVDGAAIFQGDIRLRLAHGLRVPKSVRRVVEFFGYGRRDSRHLWPNGVIPYACNDDLRPTVERAIAHWMQRTPIRFQLFAGETDFVSFVTGRGRAGASSIGREGGKSEVSLLIGGSAGTAVHEIGHIVGLWHEHARPDAEQHVRIHAENIEGGDAAMKQFLPIDGVDPIGQYDIQSIMHYPSDAFARAGTLTITLPDGSRLPPRNGLSDGDVATVKIMYPNLDWSRFAVA